MKKLILVIQLLLVSAMLSAQLININPDTTDTPWLVFSVSPITPEIQAEIDQTPELVLSSASAQITLPQVVDNSQEIYMRDVFNQWDGCCGQASGVGYTYTYEINRLRNLPSDTTDNLYPTHFTYNIVKNYDTRGSWYYQGWELIKHAGCPNVTEYGGMISLPPEQMPWRSRVWESDYDLYKNAMQNRTSNWFLITATNPEGLNNLKHWLNDHNGDSIPVGGLACFSTYMGGTTNWSPINDSIWIATALDTDSGFHAMTIVGYNDTIGWDFNGDGVLTDTIDLNGDSIITMNDWELGAVKIVNSWGDDWPSTNIHGVAYIPYKLFADTTNYGYPSKVKTIMVVNVIDNKEDLLLLKTTVAHSEREKLIFKTGYAKTAASQQPFKDKTIGIFDNQGGSFPMRSKSANDTTPLECALDFGQYYLDDDFGKIYLIIDEDDSTNTSVGRIVSYSIVDYRWGEEFELVCKLKNVPIENDTATYLSIDYDLIPHEENITVNDTFSSNMVSRFTPTINNNATLVIKKGVHVDFYNSNLVIKNGSTLIIEDSVVLYGKKGASSIDIEGNIQIGNNVVFIADSACELKLNLENTDSLYYFSIVNATFENADLFSYCDSLSVHNCVFENTSSLKGYGGDLVISESVFNNAFIYALGSQQNAIIEIDSCILNNSTIGGSPIFIDSYPNYYIHNNIISYKYGSGISIYNSTGLDGEAINLIYNNEVFNSSNNQKTSFRNTGVKIYNSKSDILGWNYIHDNDYGVSCLNYSQIKLTGDTLVKCSGISQRIINNDYHQVYISKAGIPIEFNYNEIYEPTYNTYFIYQLTQVNSTVEFDVSKNFWGENLTGTPADYIYTSMIPDWSPMCSYKSTSNAINTKYDSAVSYIMQGSYGLAEEKFKEIIEDTIISNYTFAALNQLFEIKKHYNGNYSELQSYLDSIGLIQDTTDLGSHARIISNKCDIKLKNYQTAIDFFENIVLNPTSIQDSIFAIIDLGYLYLEMNNNRSINITSKLPQYIPESRIKYEIERDYLLNLLYSNELQPSVKKEETINNSGSLVSNVVLYPNPSTNLITLEFSIKTSLSISIVIYDQLGRVIKKLHPNYYSKGMNSTTINLSALKNGTYYLSLKNRGVSIANKKIMILR